MPDIWMDVDANVTVPVNILPLIALSDFKTVLASETYDEAGLDLVWNFVTTAGVQTHVAVTPTDTGGNYDWVNIGHGMYNIEIPASGGASANNDTEGFGWFTGVATDALPWRGPVIGFRAAALNNALIDGGDTLDVNATAISGDTAAADNLESYCDGGDRMPVDVEEIGAGIITATSIATGAIDADALATDAVDKISDGNWNEPIAGHLTGGSTGAALNAAGSVGDPWSTPIPGAYGPGTAGKIVGSNLNAPVGTVDTVVDAIKLQTDKMTFQGNDIQATLDGETVDATLGTDALGANALADDAVDKILDEVIEGTYTMRQYLRLMASVLMGKTGGGGTLVLSFRDTGDVTDRVVATVDANGNRSVVTLDAS